MQFSSCLTQNSVSLSFSNFSYSFFTLSCNFYLLIHTFSNTCRRGLSSCNCPISKIWWGPDGVGVWRASSGYQAWVMQVETEPVFIPMIRINWFSEGKQINKTQETLLSVLHCEPGCSVPAADLDRLLVSVQSSLHKLQRQAHKTITRLMLGRHSAQNNTSPLTM